MHVVISGKNHTSVSLGKSMKNDLLVQADNEGNQVRAVLSRGAALFLAERILFELRSMGQEGSCEGKKEVPDVNPA